MPDAETLVVDEACPEASPDRGIHDRQGRHGGVPEGGIGGRHARRDRGRHGPDSVGQRAALAALAALSSLLARLPAAPLHRVAHVAGAGWYLAAPRQRARGRSNLRRVCQWLDANGMASPRVQAAAHDPASLERLLRDAFGHRARYYLEVAMNARVDRAFLQRHVALEDGGVVQRVLGRDGPAVVVGLHLGALELPAQYLTAILGRHAVAPMETLPNARLQAYLERSRRRTGVEVVPARGARGALERTLARGDVVGLIADRGVAGAGVRVTLFGAPARLPAGPGFLAAESRAPACAFAALRSGWANYRLIVVALDTSADGSRRERARWFLQKLAGTYERLIAEAPEQWGSIFQPLWDDLPGGARAVDPQQPGEPHGARLPVLRCHSTQPSCSAPFRRTRR